MGEVIGFVRQEDESDTVREIDLAIIPDHVWIKDEKCPHCNSVKEQELVECVNERYYETIADLMSCNDCGNLSLIVEHPIIPSQTYIMTRWKVHDKVYKKK